MVVKGQYILLFLKEIENKMVHVLISIDPRTQKKQDDKTFAILKKKFCPSFIMRSSGLAKTILQGTVKKKKRKKGRQTKRREDNIEDRTGLDFDSSTRTAEDKVEKVCC